jgi:hypothetical protein
MNESLCFKHLMEQIMFVFIFMALFCFFLFLSKFVLGKFEFREQPAGPEAREKGRILAEALAISDLRVLSARLSAPCSNFARGQGRAILSARGFFAKKWDHFLGGGDAPRSSPRG